MPRYRAQFKEVVVYDVEFDTDKRLDIQACIKEGDETWFQEMDKYSPKWVTAGCVEVEDRELFKLEKIPTTTCDAKGASHA